MGRDVLIVIIANNMPMPGVVCPQSGPVPILYEVSRLMIFRL